MTRISSENEEKPKKLIHTHLVHVKAEVSHLSKDFPRQDLKGFFNLIILLLGVNLFRLIAENIAKYGFIIPFPWTHFSLADIDCTLKVTVGLLLNTIFIYKVKKGSFFSHFLNFIMGILLPSVIVWKSQANPIINMVLLLFTMTNFLKFFSFLAFMAEYQDIKRSKKLNEKETRKAFVYFLFAPTLCFQLNYPQNDQKISKIFLIKRLVDLGSSVSAIYFIFYQFTYPTLLNSLKPMKDRNLVLIFERILKLSISSLFIWFLGFYAGFHCWLNFLAEVLRFSDKSFYKDWWNANSIEEYWRNWNLPVHNWLKRHIFKPLKSFGFSTWFSSAIVFLLSAVAHEYIISVALREFHWWAFGAMLLQLPLVKISRLYMNLYPTSTFGNMFFWTVFCFFGQPMMILLYYYSFMRKSNV